MKKIYKYAFWATISFFILTVIVFSANMFPALTGNIIKTDNVPLPDGPCIQIALLLDTSGSMSGLIEQTKAYLWKMVNQLSLTEKGGKKPELRVALYEYGNDSLSVMSGYIRRIVPFTSDLDLLYEELFNLTTNGGSEFCGMVIGKALGELEWSSREKDMKLVFIAGNEPFTQGSVNYEQICKTAAGKGVIVNTIHCGGYEEGVDGFWKNGAELGNGKYLCIDHNQEIVAIDAPQDDEIARLNAELNDTYIPYGNEGIEYKIRQEAQDVNASSMSREILVQRAKSKSTDNYRNSSWDLVDAVTNNEISMDKVNQNDLPENLKKMTRTEQKKYIAEMTEKRKTIQERINVLYNDREEYVKEQQKSASIDNSLDAALSSVLLEQAAAQGFSLTK